LSRATALWVLLACPAISGCSTLPPQRVDNICAIFREKDDWYEDAADARDRWGSDIPVMMAIMYQESRFEADARPPRRTILGFIPGPRPSNAYGYSQAKTDTWKEYKQDAGGFGADRDDFADAIDFIGWYNARSTRSNGISPHDAYGLYLAYHEGNGGYSRSTYLAKPWLLDVARRVEARAVSYQAQLAACEEELERGRGFFGWF
jgi:hypothetical protein